MLIVGRTAMTRLRRKRERLEKRRMMMMRLRMLSGPKAVNSACWRLRATNLGFPVVLRHHFAMSWLFIDKFRNTKSNITSISKRV